MKKLAVFSTPCQQSWSDELNSAISWDQSISFPDFDDYDVIIYWDSNTFPKEIELYADCVCVKALCNHKTLSQMIRQLEIETDNPATAMLEILEAIDNKFNLY